MSFPPVDPAKYKVGPTPAELAAQKAAQAAAQAAADAAAAQKAAEAAAAAAKAAQDAKDAEAQRKLTTGKKNVMEAAIVKQLAKEGPLNEAALQKYETILAEKKAAAAKTKALDAGKKAVLADQPVSTNTADILNGFDPEEKKALLSGAAKRKAQSTLPAKLARLRPRGVAPPKNARKTPPTPTTERAGLCAASSCGSFVSARPVPRRLRRRS